MLPKYHLIFGILFIIILHFLFLNLSLISLLIIFISNILIDIDHFVYYTIKKKKFNFFEAYKWYSESSKIFDSLSKKQKSNFYFGFYALHGIELLIILFVLGLSNKLLLMIFLGFSFHFIIDFLYSIKKQQTFQKFSWIYNFTQRKKKSCFSITKEMIRKE